MKTCTKCKESKKLKEFHKSSGKKDGLALWCRTCVSTAQRKYYQKNKKKVDLKVNSYRASNKESRDASHRRSYLKRRYGITTEQYDQLLVKQGYKCPVCLKGIEELSIRLAVDHNHFTGEIRGLLCTNCNHRVIGRHRDPDVLQRASDYLRNQTGWFVPPVKKRKKRKT